MFQPRGENGGHGVAVVCLVDADFKNALESVMIPVTLVDVEDWHQVKYKTAKKIPVVSSTFRFQNIPRADQNVLSLQSLIYSLKSNSD